MGIVCGLHPFSSPSAFLWQQELGSSNFLGDSPISFVPTQAFSLQPRDRMYLVWSECQCCKSSFQGRMCQVLSQVPALCLSSSAVGSVFDQQLLQWVTLGACLNVASSDDRRRCAPALRMCCSSNCVAPQGFLTLPVFKKTPTNHHPQ